MTAVTLEEAKTHLRDLIEAAAAGEEVFITKDGQASVQLVPVPSPQSQPRIGGLNPGSIETTADYDEPLLEAPRQKRKRQFGSARGLISMAPDFDEPV